MHTYSKCHTLSNFVQELEAKRDRINKEREAAYQQWIENYTVQEIADANNARRWLKKHEVNRVTTTPLYDHRRVKRVSGPYAFFIKEQLKGNSQTEPQEGRMKAASQRWTTLTEMDKKVCTFPFSWITLTSSSRILRWQLPIRRDMKEKSRLSLNIE